MGRSRRIAGGIRGSQAKDYGYDRGWVDEAGREESHGNTCEGLNYY